jgi:integrase
VLFNFGIRELDLEMLNPAAKMRRDGEAESFASWSVDEMITFEESAPPVHLMTAYMVGRYTGPRRSDIARLRRNDYNGVTLRIAGNKTNNEILVRAHSNLRSYLNGLPKTLSLIADDLGRPITPDRLSKDLRAHLDSIGLNHLHLHGLRHTAGKELAEAGCTPHEIAAVLGHETLQMVEHYTKTAAQKRMAQSAVMKLERRTKTKQDSAKRAAKPR